MLEQLVLPEVDMRFSLDHAISMVTHQVDSKLVLPSQAAQVQPGETILALVVTKMTHKGFFWVRLSSRNRDGVLSVISHSIKLDIE